MSGLTHLNDGGEAHMVDITAKSTARRVAVACGTITMSDQALSAIRSKDVAKGNVLATARIAGIMAAKKTADIIPLCHSVQLEQITVAFDFLANGLRATVTASLDAKTGVEMEAMVGASAALLTIYDMAKAIDKSMVIGDIYLLSKTGGKSGEWGAPERNLP